MGDRRYPILLALNLIGAAHCMITQMALSVTLSFVAGHSIDIFALFVGIYLAAMGGGVLVVERLSADTQGWIERLLLLLIVAALAASPGVPGLMLAHEMVGEDVSIWIAGVGLSLVLGGVTGATLPIISRVGESAGWPAAKPLIAALTSEYVGAFLGTIAFALVLYPHVGLVRAVVLSQGVAILAVNLATIGLGVARAKPALVLPGLLLLDCWVAASFSFQDEFVAFLDRAPL